MRKKEERAENPLVIGLVDEQNITSVSMGVTINLQGYNNIKMMVEGTDAESCRRALIEALSMNLPLRGEVEKECVENYLRNVLVRPTIPTPPLK